MEITLDYIEQLLTRADAFFMENIDTAFAVSKPSGYVVKLVSELSPWPSYDEIWNTGDHLSAAQLTDFLLGNSDKYNFWDFQLVKVQSSSLCIILFLNYYPEQKELGLHFAFPNIYDPKDSHGPGDRCVFLIVKSVIDELGSDDFDIASREISQRVSKDRTPEAIASVISEVFNKHLGIQSQPGEFIKPATKIKKRLMKRAGEDQKTGIWSWLDKLQSIFKG